MILHKITSEQSCIRKEKYCPPAAAPSADAAVSGIDYRRPWVQIQCEFETFDQYRWFSLMQK